MVINQPTSRQACIASAAAALSWVVFDEGGRVVPISWSQRLQVQGWSEGERKPALFQLKIMSFMEVFVVQLKIVFCRDYVGQDGQGRRKC